MSDTMIDRIAQLSDKQALDAAESMATLLEAELEAELDVALDTASFDALVRTNRDTVGDLHDGLVGAKLSEEQAAAGARSLLLLAADLGFEKSVQSALEASEQHERDFGLLSGTLVLAGLAVVLAHVPKEKRATTTRIKHLAKDGSFTETETTDERTTTVGAEAVTALSSWWKALLGK